MNSAPHCTYQSQLFSPKMETFIGKENDHRKIKLHWAHDKHPSTKSTSEVALGIERILKNVGVEMFSLSWEELGF